MTARRGQPRVGNNSGGRLDAEERAHGRGEHGSAGEGSAVDLGEGGAGEGDWVDYLSETLANGGGVGDSGCWWPR